MMTKTKWLELVPKDWASSSLEQRVTKVSFASMMVIRQKVYGNSLLCMERSVIMAVNPKAVRFFKRFPKKDPSILLPYGFAPS